MCHRGIPLGRFTWQQLMFFRIDPSLAKAVPMQEKRASGKSKMVHTMAMGVTMRLVIMISSIRNSKVFAGRLSLQQPELWQEHGLY